MNDSRSSLFISALLLLLLLILAWSPPRDSQAPRGEEATFLLMVESLWHDQDLRFEREDLVRGYRHWPDGPVGVQLVESPGESLAYARPVVPALVALPFVGVFGSAGISVVGVLLLAALLFGAGWIASPDSRKNFGFPAFFLLASALPAYALRLESTLISVALVGIPFLLWIFLRGATAGGLTPWQRGAVASGIGVGLGAAFTVEGLLLVLLVPPVVDLLLSRRLRRWVPPLLVGFLVTVGLVGALQRKGTGEWRPAAPERGAVRAFHGPYPLEPAFQPSPSPPRQVGQGDWAVGARRLPGNIKGLLLGRYGGVLPYFPTALLALFLFLRQRQARRRPGWLVLTAGSTYLLLLLLVNPDSYRGASQPGVGAFGNVGFALLYPALLFLPFSSSSVALRWRSPAVLLTALAAALWTVPAVVSSWSAPGTDGHRHVRGAAFSALPLEVPLATSGALEDFWVRSGGDALWLLPRHAFFAEENNPLGVWMAGSSRAEVLVVTPEAQAALPLRVQALSGDNVFTAATSGGTVRVHFDTPAKRRATSLEIPLGKGRAVVGGGRVGGGWVYRLEVSSSDGLQPWRWDAASGDPRYLGTFLAFGETP